MKDIIKKDKENLKNSFLGDKFYFEKNQNNHKNLCIFNYNILFDTLRRSNELSLIVSGIYNYIPSTASYPYIHIEEQNIDLQIESGFVTTESICDIYIYDEGESSQRTLGIMDNVCNILRLGVRSKIFNNSSNLTDCFFLRSRVIDSQITNEQLDDGCYWRGKIRFVLQGYTGS